MLSLKVCSVKPSYGYCTRQLPPPGHSEVSVHVGRTSELDVIIKLHERTVAGGTILSAKQLLKKNEGEIFA